MNIALPSAQRALHFTVVDRQWVVTAPRHPVAARPPGPGPVDRRKQGLKCSVATEAAGIPLAALPAPANHRDDGLLAATLDALGAVGPLPAQPVVHLDAGYDDQPCRQS